MDFHVRNPPANAEIAIITGVTHQKDEEAAHINVCAASNSMISQDIV